MSASSNDDLPPVLLDRYLAGECSGDEVELIHAWVAAHPANAAQLRELQRIRDVATHRPVWDVRGMWGTLSARMEEEKSGDEQHRSVPAADVGPSLSRIPVRGRGMTFRSSRRSSYAIPVWARAAAVLVIVSSAALGWHALDLHRNRVEAAREALADRTYTTYATQAGQRAEITLSDGSRVTLGVASTLRVPQSFNAKRRVLKLEGEALFSVEHNAAKPFLVYSPHAVTEDIGTEFGVRAYASEGMTRVVVRSGEVALRDADEPASRATHLTARQMGRVSSNGTMHIDRDVDPDQYLAWASGALVFRKAPLIEVAAELGRWYDLDVLIADKRLNDKTLTASFKGDPMRDVLHMIEGTLDVRAERHGRSVTLYPKGNE